ncbi:MAG: Mth938-like domain-containing protein [Burkholderiales bacterium]
MKLHLARGEGRNQITSAGSGYVSVNGTRYQTSVVVTPDSISDWPVAEPSALNAADIGSLLEHTPEIALIGTGARLQFPPAAVLRPLIDAGIGYEVMDTAAACRTYAILMAEGRRVVAALIVA